MCGLSYTFRYQEIIEIYWNVNGIRHAILEQFKDEIIETYWNVNLGNKIRDGIVETEIIETYWNILKCK